jgi:TPR repeat protein
MSAKIEILRRGKRSMILGWMLLIATLGLAYWVGGSEHASDAEEPRDQTAQFMAELHSRANQGDPQAQYRLGKLYLNGKGVYDSPVDAALWIQKAADNGHVPAMVDAGKMFRLGRIVDQNPAIAEFWLEQAARLGDREAQFQLGEIYYMREGMVIRLNDAGELDAIAVQNFRLAAQQGHPNAQFHLGYMYRLGNAIIDPDPKKAVYWFQKSAAQGFIYGQRELGGAYLYGEGVDKDFDLAMKWLEKAAIQGSVIAQQMLDKVPGYSGSHGYSSR